MSKNMFEVATRLKLRFPYRGMISVEDLWDLSVQSLDKVFKALNSQRKQAQEESLLNAKSSEDEVLDTQIEIVTQRSTVSSLQSKLLESKRLRIKKRSRKSWLLWQRKTMKQWRI